MRRFVLLLIFLLASCSLVAQRENVVWWFGNGVGLDFSGPIPLAIRSPLGALEGCATICDGRTGALLMATNGRQVYNRQGGLMPNGADLAGHDNATQSALILPAPRRPGIYYLFAQDAAPYVDPPNDGLSYSIIDMSRDGGLGDVVVRNVPLLSNTAEKLAAVRDTSGCGFWVVTHGAGDDRFHAFHVTASGVDSAVITSIGALHADPSGEPVGSGAIGWMRFSPDGRRLAVATYTLGIVEILHFDPATGRVSSPLRLPPLPYAYGICFSPDGTRLYVSTNTGDRVPRRFELVQFDMTLADSAAVAGSMVVVGVGPDPVPRHFGALQLGPDGRIYMARAGDRWLSIIERPNITGMGCGFLRDGVDLAIPLGSTFSLPNYVDDLSTRGGLDCSLPRAEFQLSDTVVCIGSCVRATDLSTNNPTSWRWFSDGLTPTEVDGRDPGLLCFQRAGRWLVGLAIANGDGVDTSRRWITVVEGGILSGRLEGPAPGEVGDTMTLRLTVSQARGLSAAPVHVSLAIPPRSLRFVEARAGPMATGWSVDQVDRDDTIGQILLRLTPPPGIVLEGSGHLLDIRCRLFLDSTMTIPIGLDMSGVAPGCFGGVREGGVVQLQGCMLRERGMEVGREAYGLRGPDPSPATGETMLDLGVGLDGETAVTIHSLDGREVARPLQGRLGVGRHTIRLDLRGLSPGIFFLIVRSGT